MSDKTLFTKSVVKLTGNQYILDEQKAKKVSLQLEYNSANKRMTGVQGGKASCLSYLIMTLAEDSMIIFTLDNLSSNYKLELHKTARLQADSSIINYE